MKYLRVVLAVDCVQDVYEAAPGIGYQRRVASNLEKV